MGQFIMEMVLNNRAPSTSKKLLYKLIKMKESSITFIDNEWIPSGGSRKQKGSKGGDVGVGAVALVLQSVMVDGEQLTPERQYWGEISPNFGKTIITSLPYAHPKSIYLCEFIDRRPSV